MLTFKYYKNKKRMKKENVQIICKKHGKFTKLAHYYFKDGKCDTRDITKKFINKANCNTYEYFY